DHLEGDVSVVVAEEQGPEPHHEIEDLVAVDVVDVAAVAVVRQKGMRPEVADVALDPTGGQPAGAAPQLRALPVPREIFPAELLGRHRITSRRNRGRLAPTSELRAPSGALGPNAKTPRPARAQSPQPDNP